MELAWPNIFIVFCEHCAHASFIIISREFPGIDKAFFCYCKFLVKNHYLY
jgi:hypothetical protein